MSGLLIVLLLAVAIPLGIVVFTVKSTASERKAYEHVPVSRFISALAFGIAALLGVLLLVRGTSSEYSPAVAFILGFPVAVIAALLGVASHRIIVGRSKFIAALSGAGIALLTAASTPLAFALAFAPDHNAALFVASFGAVIMVLPQGVPIIVIGACAGVLLNYLSNRRRPNTPLNTDAPPSGGASVS